MKAGRIVRLFGAFTIAALLGSCSLFGINVPIEGISVQFSITTLAVGSSGTLRVTFVPANATGTALTWSSSDDDIATVSQGGIVTGIASGKATIHVVTKSGSLGASCEVTVVPALYAVGSTSGNIYEINISSGLASANPLVSTAQNSTGEVLYAQGRGFVAVGSYNNSAPGLYTFNPASPAAGCTQIGANISAQYFTVTSSTKGYVTSADFMGTYANALYSFDPSNPVALTKVIDLANPQEVVQGGDGKVYVAENGSGKLARIDGAAGTIEAEIACTSGGATGLLAGSLNGVAGIFVANTGGFDSSWNALPGSLDFVSNSGSTASAVVAGISFARVAALSPTLLVASGGYPAKTWLIDLSAAAISPVEVKSGSSSFGGSDIAVIGGKAYLPDGTNTVYVFGSDAVVSAISVGSTGDLVTNVGIAQ